MLEANILEENYLVQSLEQTAITLSVLHRTVGLSNKSQRSCQLHVAESGLELVLFFFFFSIYVLKLILLSIAGLPCCVSFRCIVK